MLVVAVSVEYCVGHSQLALSVSDTVQAASRLVTAARRGLAGTAAPSPAPGEIVAGRVGSRFPACVAAPVVVGAVAAAWLAAAGAGAELAAADIAPAASRPGTANVARASLACPPRP